MPRWNRKRGVFVSLSIIYESGVSMAVAKPFKVLLISPSSERFYVPSAPLGLSSLAGALPEGVETEGLDLNVLKWVHGLDSAGLIGTVEHYFRKALACDALPDMIGITVYQETLGEAARIAGLAQKVGIPVVAGGIFPTMFPELIPDDFDLLVRGDGRVPFRRIAEALMRFPGRFPDGELAAIPGVYLHSASGEWSGDEQMDEQTFDKVAYPIRGIFDGFNMGFRYYSARVVSSSGCPYACKFCANSEFAHREWRPRPVEDIVGEIEALLADETISEISFSDDQFLGFAPAHYRRALQLLERLEVITRRRNLRINLQVRADHFLEALTAEEGLAEVLMAINRNFEDPSAETSMGLHGREVRGLALDIGVESFIDRRLQAMGKAIRAERNIAAVRKAKALGLDLGVYMVTFTPDLTWEELRMEYAIFLAEVVGGSDFSKAAFFNFFQELIPYRGTSIYRELKSAGALVEEGPFTGFRFEDPRVAAFYLSYLHSLYLADLASANTRQALYREIDRCFSISAGVDKHPAAVDVVREVVCEIKDGKVLGRLYEGLMKALG